MKTRGIALLFCLVFMGVGAACRRAADRVPQNIGPLEGVQTPSSMAAEGNDLFVVDENHVVRVYSIDPFALRFTVGGKGDGPQELKYPPSLWITAETIVVSDFLKSLWFTRGGPFLKAVAYSDFPDFNTGQEMQLFPAGNRLLRNIVDHATRKRTVILLDAELRPLGTLYEGLFDWNQVGGQSGFNLLTHRIEVAAGDGEIFVSDTEKGFFIRVFDLDGNTVATIDLTSSEESVPVSEDDRGRLLEEVRRTRSENVYNYAAANARYPDAFPRIHHVRYSGGRLYVTTHREKEGLHEMLVLDTRGKVLDRLFLPIPSFHHFRGPFRSDLFAASGGALYELVQNPETRVWELLRTGLSKR
ncbi:MAG: hypothetical protein OEW05_00850 [Candidatus Aminicenantes bacterium]|nr:hypothetical protein [Candidatus Aminicenantes bacterium]